jgi:choice-of-anchor B domain-containing protein
MKSKTTLPLLVGLGLTLSSAVAFPQTSGAPDIVLLRNLDRGESYSGNWGYTSPTGVELAISGTRSGTTFINATNPTTATEVAFIPGPISGWREMATYGEYCYIVTESEGAALQVVSLANPLAPVLVTTLNPPAVPFVTAHEIKIDQQTGYLYAAGTNVGLVILDLTVSPTNPTVRGSWTGTYVHDLSLLNGKAYCAAIFAGRIYVLDVTQPGTPPVVGTPWTWPNAFPHNTWPTEDGNFLVTTDENNGGHLRMWDISNLSQVTQTDDILVPTGSIIHNAYIRGNYCYMSYYRDGLRVVDVSDPYNLVAAGWYDTHPAAGPDYEGAWGCWCFAADPGIAYISDMQTGTYILRFNPATTGIEEPGRVTPALPMFLGNFPNPFHPATAIRFELPQATAVKLRVFDPAGRAVRVLVDGARAAGTQSVVWDGRDDAARPVASGVYYYRLEAPDLDFSAAKGMVLAR